jgi:hypothetical protein
MAGRYLITGVQLGIIKGLVTTLQQNQSSPEKAHNALIGLQHSVEEVMMQFIGNSNKPVLEDVERLKQINLWR